MPRRSQLVVSAAASPGAAGTTVPKGSRGSGWDRMGLDLSMTLSFAADFRRSGLTRPGLHRRTTGEMRPPREWRCGCLHPDGGGLRLERNLDAQAGAAARRTV